MATLEGKWKRGVRMKGLFSGSTVERYPTGQLVIGFGAPIGFHLIAAVVVPLVFVGAMYFVFGGGPLGPPWWLYAGGAAMGCFSIVFLLWFGARSRVQVIVDRKKSSLLIQTREGRTELPLREVSNASIGSVSGPKASTGYRLEFVLRSGERVPATSGYFNFYMKSDRARVVEAINQELIAFAKMIL
jgi:hypothetical protein